MAKNETRSLNTSLDTGATDGTYRSVRPNTEVADQPGHAQMMKARAGLHPFMNYGYPTHEGPGKQNPGRP